MLSDEEKKAIKEIEDYLDYEGSVSIQAIATLYTSYNKEKEELKKYKKYYEEMEEVNKKFIAVDKIKAKIEELKEDIKYSANPLSIDNSKFGIKVLQSLLEKE